MPDDLDEATGRLVRGALTIGPVGLMAGVDVVLSVLDIRGDDGAITQAINDDRADMIEEVRRRIAAVERELLEAKQEPVRARPATVLEILVEAVALLPACVDERVRTAKMNAVARRVVFARESNRGLVEHWWNELEKLSEGEIRLLYLAGEGAVSIESSGLRIRIGPGETYRREALTAIEVGAAQAIYARDSMRQTGRLFQSDHAGIRPGHDGVQLLGLIRDPPGLSGSASPAKPTSPAT